MSGYIIITGIVIFIYFILKSGKDKRQFIVEEEVFDIKENYNSLKNDLDIDNNIFTYEKEKQPPREVEIHIEEEVMSKEENLKYIPNKEDDLIPNEEFDPRYVYEDIDDLSDDELLNPGMNKSLNEEYENDDTVLLEIDMIKREDKGIYLISKNQNEAPKVINFNKDKIVIGRLRDQVDYYIDMKPISRKHACIYKQQNKYFVRDLNSKNKTFINGYELEPDKLYEILDESTITFGDVEFTFKIRTN